jgi:hydroxymethylpyrimidine pyrophosphatase-like HAD family hydrolase
MRVSAVNRVEEFLSSSMIKLTVVCRDARAWDTVSRELAASSFPWRVQKSRPYYLEVSPGGASKEKALAALVAQLGVSSLIAVGDGENDIGMFRLACRSYAVPSAAAIVRNAASCVLDKPADLALSRLIESIAIGAMTGGEPGNGEDSGHP